MPCDTRPNLNEQQRARQVEALRRLQAAIGAGAVRIVVGRSGGIALVGWKDDEREGLTDVCAWRRIANTPEARRALVRAEAMSGNRMDPLAVASGLHSHDGGATWSRH